MTPMFQDGRRHPEDRARQVLVMAVEQYIQTHRPVASASLAERADVDVSPATIRNIFFELEEAGYLTHPHTSAGRVPTDRGYRLYVDEILRRRRLEVGAPARRRGVFHARGRRLDDVMVETCRLLSARSRYTGFVTTPRPEEPMDHRQVYLDGTEHILGESEFLDLETVRAWLHLVEQPRRLGEPLAERLLRTADEASDRVHGGTPDAGQITVLIGHENPLRAMRDFSVVGTAYRLGGGARGVLGVIGPRPMRYSHVIALVGGIRDVLSRVLGERGE